MLLGRKANDMIAHERKNTNGSWSIKGAMYNFSLKCYFFLPNGRKEITPIIASYCAIGGAPFVQQKCIEILAGKHPWFFH